MIDFCFCFTIFYFCIKKAFSKNWVRFYCLTPDFHHSNSWFMCHDKWKSIQIILTDLFTVLFAMIDKYQWLYYSLLDDMSLEIDVNHSVSPSRIFPYLLFVFIISPYLFRFYLLRIIYIHIHIHLGIVTEMCESKCGVLKRWEIFRWEIWSFKKDFHELVNFSLCMCIFSIHICATFFLIHNKKRRKKSIAFLKFSILMPCDY